MTRKFPAKYRAFLLLIIFCLLVSVVFGISIGDTVFASSESPVLSGAEIDYPESSCADPGNGAAGFSVALLRTVAATMKREVSFTLGYAEMALDKILPEGRL